MSTSLSRVRTTQAQSQAQKAQIQQACRNCLQPGHRIAVCTELCTTCANPPCGVIPSQCPVYIAKKAEEKNTPRRKGKEKKEAKVVKISDIPATAGKALRRVPKSVDESKNSPPPPSSPLPPHGVNSTAVTQGQ